MKDAELEAARERIAKLERDNARLLQKLAEQRQLTEASRVASIALLEALDLQEVLDTLLDCLAQVVPFDAGCVLLLEDDDHVVMQAGLGYDDFEPGEVVLEVADRPHLHQIVRTMRSHRIDDTWRDEGWQRGIDVSEDTRSWLGVPLTARGVVLGLFGLDRREPNGFSDEHVRLAELLAAHAALAIANARLYARLAGR
ncbi:MAG: GAF domain-containing protein [Alphaproteobacteria bacterium]|nr:GAF domain-containing protein [Alphaproteobacteria bacterium]MCB9696741.1 GAF domain-containing protein [Alphaproteobacteria bacterium]